MKNNYLTVVAYLFLSAFGINKSSAQSGPQFLECSDTISLCIEDEGVRLPVNNKFFLGEEDPDATSCSVHITQKRKVKSTCGSTLRYEVQLFLNDTSAPFILQPPTYIHTDSIGEAELSFDSELAPDMSLKENGIPYTTGCMPFHRIRWIVSDSCGNTVSCENLIDIYDCFKPVFSVPTGHDILFQPMSAFLRIYLKDIYRQPKDDCTYSEEYLFSFSSDFHTPDSTFDICDFEIWGIDFLYDIWIADKGRDMNCDGIIEWSERRIEKEQIKIIVIDPGYIDCWYTDPILAGNILTEFGEGIEDVQVSIDNSQMYPTYFTAEDGHYFFGHFQSLPLTIRAERNDNHKNGVSTLDIVKIQKHLLGKEIIKNPYRLIAADANNSKNISVIDLLEIRKLILGIDNDFKYNSSWRFVPENFVIDSINPFVFDEEIVVENESEVMDFIGIKIGDVNYTVQPNARNLIVRNSHEKIEWYSEQMQFKENDYVDIKFYLNDEIDIQGFQFTLSDPDLEFVEASSTIINIDESSYALFDDKMTFSWFDESGVKLSNEDIVFTVKARAKKDGSVKHNLSINSDITEAEVYSMTDEIFTPELAIPGENTYSSLAPEPNPWKESTIIPFTLAKEGAVSFEIFDLNGQQIYSRNEMQVSGENKFLITSDHFTQRGLLFYSLTTDSAKYSGKMIVLD